jgi:nitrate/nitrite transport system substrate-binding protein
MIAHRDDYREIAAAINQTELYRDAAESMGIAIPAESVSQRLIDGRVWDGSEPDRYATGFEIHA